MKRPMVLIGIATAFVALSAFSAPATADGFGLRVAGRGYLVDIGRGHYGAPYYDGYRSYKVGYGYGGHGCHGDRGVWHDTSHYDYHPGEFVRHRDHFDYVPGHYDFHETGHWDHYGW